MIQNAFDKLFDDQDDYILDSNITVNYRYFYDRIQKMELTIDESVMEIFISDGEYTMTSRFYDNEKDLFIRFEGINEIETYKMKGFKTE